MEIHPGIPRKSKIDLHIFQFFRTANVSSEDWKLPGLFALGLDSKALGVPKAILMLHVPLTKLLFAVFNWSIGLCGGEV